MPAIRLSTTIQAPREVCFDLSRSIDLHMISTARTGESAVAGRTSGLMSPGETVTWRARHFGVWQTLTSWITTYDRPAFFVDEMLRGAFQSFRHEHRFETSGSMTLMHDTFTYTSPLGFLGRFADLLFLEKYMRRLLEERNAVIREYAESGKWEALISGDFWLS